MSLTAFFAVCILSIDFMIYFFFKLIYAEKKDRVVHRRLPPEYYSDVSLASRRSKGSSPYPVRAHKSQQPNAKRILTMAAGRDSPIIGH